MEVRQRDTAARTSRGQKVWNSLESVDGHQLLLLDTNRNCTTSTPTEGELALYACTTFLSSSLLLLLLDGRIHKEIKERKNTVVLQVKKEGACLTPSTGAPVNACGRVTSCGPRVLEATVSLSVPPRPSR